MRQAGRYLPEYRRLRERHAFLEMVRSPELACEVTLQPLRRFDLDAAIIFADILPPLTRLGFHVEFADGRGPRISDPVRAARDVARLPVVDDDEAWAFTLQAIRLVRRELPAQVALIGFSGAPFTLACYAIEGAGSRDFALARRFMVQEPQAWKALMGSLAALVGRYLRSQVAAGAQVVQLFDTWAGLLTPEEYRQYALPYSAQALAAVGEVPGGAVLGGSRGVPRISFAAQSAALLELLRETGAEVVSVGQDTDLATAWDRLGEGVAVQGNLDPRALLGDQDTLHRAAAAVLASAAGRLGYIFNLGHGVLPQTPPENVERLVEIVHAHDGQQADDGRRAHDKRQVDDGRRAHGGEHARAGR